jgi:hypothetical protein
VKEKGSWKVLSELGLDDAGATEVSAVWIRADGDLHLGAEEAFELAAQIQSAAYCVGLPVSVDGRSTPAGVVRLDDRGNAG